VSLPAQGGILSYAVQPAKIGADGTFDASTLDWYKVRAPRIAIGPQQDQQVFPLETGGPLTPSGAFKQAKFFAGQVDLIPRLKDTFGWLLLGALGKASSVTGKNADGVTTTGVNTHIFSYNPALPSDQPWLAVRRLVPGVTSAEADGATGFDCKVASMRFICPAMGKIAAQITMIGRDFDSFDDGSTWTYVNSTFEDSLTTADSGNGQFAINGVEYPVTGCTVDINNGLTTPQQEMIIGSYSPDDFVALTRGVQVRFVYKYENPELHRAIYTGTVNGVDWSNLPFIKDSASGNYALDLRFAASTNIGATSTPFGIRVRANRVTVAEEGTIELVAGGIIQQTFVATVLEPDSGNYCEVVVENAVTSYVVA
jgi:tail tube protein